MECVRLMFQELEVVILTTDKQVIRFRQSITDSFIYNKKLYKLNPDWIAIKQKDSKNKHLEVYYFENDPIPIGVKGYNSANFLDEVIGENFLKQTADLEKEKIKVNWFLILMVLGVASIILTFVFYPDILKVIKF